MAIVNFTGFEGGTNVSNHDFILSNGVDVVSDVKRTGNYSAKVTSILNGQQWLALTGYTNVGANTTLSVENSYVQFYFRYETLPSSGVIEIFTVESTVSQRKLSIVINSAGKLSVTNGNSLDTGAGSTTLSADTWYKINVRCGTGSSANYELKINDGTEFSGTHDLYSNNAQRYYCGNYITNAPNTGIIFYYDDVVVDDAGFLSGDAEVKVITPTGSGSTMTWSGTYEDINSVPHSDSTEIISPTSGAPNVALFDMETASSKSITGTILGIRAVIRTRRPSGTSSTAFRLKSGATTVDSTSYNDTTFYQSRCFVFTQNPNTSSAWTLSTLDDAEFGFVQNNNMAMRASCLQVMVAYLPSTISNTADFFQLF
jgi:hypothetical protein